MGRARDGNVRAHRQLKLYRLARLTASILLSGKRGSVQHHDSTLARSQDKVTGRRGALDGAALFC